MKKADIRKLDTKIRVKLRELCNNKCEECGQFMQGMNSQVSHGYSRRYQGIRWDRLNVLALDAKCHWQYGNNPIEANIFLLKHLGQAGLNELMRRKQSLNELKLYRLDPDKITAYIEQLTLGKYPDVSPIPLWRL